MIAHTMKYRALIYAAIYAPSEPIPRAEATKYYNALAEGVFPRLGFQYAPEGEDTKFRIEMVEKQGREQNIIVVDAPPEQNGGLRLVLDQSWRESSTVACERADHTFQLAQSLVRNREQLLAEVRIRAQAVADTTGSIASMKSVLGGDRQKKLDNLGKVCHLGVSVECEPELPATHSLGSPKRTVSLETLREDKSCIYLEVMSQWGRRALRTVDATTKELVEGPLAINTEDPSAYLKETMEFMQSSVCSLVEDAR